MIRDFTTSSTRRRIHKFLEEPDSKVVTGSSGATSTMDAAGGVRRKWRIDSNVLKGAMEVVRMMALL